MLRRPRGAWLQLLARPTGHHWSWAATIALGLGQVAWIGLELLYLPELSWLEAVYSATGVALALLPLVPAVSHHLREKPS